MFQLHLIQLVSSSGDEAGSMDLSLLGLKYISVADYMLKLGEFNVFYCSSFPSLALLYFSREGNFLAEQTTYGTNKTKISGSFKNCSC